MKRKVVNPDPKEKKLQKIEEKIQEKELAEQINKKEEEDQEKKLRDKYKK